MFNLEFNFDGEKEFSENGNIKQYTLSTRHGQFKCDCGCNVFTKFKELYNNEEIYECNVCSKYWSSI